MNNLYKLTKEIHDVLRELKFIFPTKIQMEMPYNVKHNITLLTSNAIRQILVALEGVLGESNEHKNWKRLGAEIGIHGIIQCDHGFQDYARRMYAESKPLYSFAEIWCNRWLDGLNPLFDREPETVLKELLEILEKF